MTDTALLDKMIQASGLKYAYIAKQIGLSAYGFARKRKNLSDFTSREIDGLCELLHIDRIEDRFAIFFAKEVDEKSTARATL